MKICYFNTDSCINVEVMGRQRKDATLGTVTYAIFQVFLSGEILTSLRFGLLSGSGIWLVYLFESFCPAPLSLIV